MKKLYRSHISSADSGGSDAQQADTRQSPQSSVTRGTSGLSEAVPDLVGDRIGEPKKSGEAT
jgi:hypothetical protein